MSCSPDRGTFLVNSTTIKLDMPGLMFWTMINLLILFDTEFKVSDFFFLPDIAFVRIYMDGAGMILFHSSRGFLGLLFFFLLLLLRCGGVCILSGLYI